MAKWVYSFGDGKAEGRADMHNLLGGKGANLAEMSSLGLPVPPGFTITTEVCTCVLRQQQHLSAPSSKDEVERGAGRGREGGGPASSATRNNPLLVSVRSGARASMPGMMDTVLNLGLNDATVRGPRPSRRATSASPATATAASSRCTATSCSASSTTISRRSLEHAQGRSRRRPMDTELTAAGLAAAWSPSYKDDRREATPASRSRRTRRSSSGAPSARCSARWMNQRAITYRRLHDIPDELGHRGQRAGDGVRQHGRRLRHRRRLHPRPLDRREPVLRRVPGQRPGRGRGGRHPHAAAPDRRRARRRRSPTLPAMEEVMPAVFAQLDGGAPTGSRRTTATCRTSSSPSSRASSTCCRRATASAPPRPRCKIAVDMVREGLIDQKEAVRARRSRLARPAAAPHARPQGASARCSPRACRPRPGAASGKVVFIADEAEKPRAPRARR